MPDSSLKALGSPIAVVCHDAGAANLILAWLDQSDLQRILPVIQGPARQSWLNRFGFAPPVVNLNEAIASAGSLLSGTGWGSDLEHRARRLALKRQVYNVAVIDHWVNFKERFERNGETVLPDRIWVTDHCAAALARQALGLPIDLKRNAYLEQQVALIGPPNATGDVLFVAEPARSDWNRDRLGEFQALDYFLAHRTAAGIARDMSIRLRLHPSDNAAKYDGWLDRAGEMPIRIDRAPSLAEAMLPAQWVAGCQSYALIVAIATGRKALSVLPPWAPACVLPETALLHLKAMAVS